MVVTYATSTCQLRLRKAELQVVISRLYIRLRPRETLLWDVSLLSASSDRFPFSTLPHRRSVVYHTT